MMTIWIGGLPWVLKLEPDLCGGGGEFSGLCFYDSSLIVVEQNLSVSERRRAFWREAFHAAHFQAGIISDAHSELHIDILASAVFSMLALNPLLVDPNFLCPGPTIEDPHLSLQLFRR